MGCVLLRSKKRQLTQRGAALASSPSIAWPRSTWDRNSVALRGADLTRGEHPGHQRGRPRHKTIRHWITSFRSLIGESDLEVATVACKHAGLVATAWEQCERQFRAVMSYPIPRPDKGLISYEKGILLVRRSKCRSRLPSLSRCWPASSPLCRRLNESDQVRDDAVCRPSNTQSGSEGAYFEINQRSCGSNQCQSLDVE
jgi:hypothetical protein